MEPPKASNLPNLSRLVPLTVPGNLHNQNSHSETQSTRNPGVSNQSIPSRTPSPNSRSAPNHNCVNPPIQQSMHLNISKTAIYAYATTISHRNSHASHHPEIHNPINHNPQTPFKTTYNSTAAHPPLAEPLTQRT